MFTRHAEWILLRALLATACGACLLCACGHREGIPLPLETPQKHYAIDELTGSGNAATELDSDMLAELNRRVEAGDYGDIHSLLIVHNGELTHEQYFRGWTRHMLHPVYSISKTVTAGLIGIAIDQGAISGLEEHLLDFFPEYAGSIDNLDERKEAIELRHVLTQTSGFAWHEGESYRDYFNIFSKSSDLMKMYRSSDWVKFMLDLPMQCAPGAAFLPNSGAPILLAGVLYNRTGMTAEEYADQHLFSRLGISVWQWSSGPNNITNTSGGLSLHPANLAMLGYVYLNNGSYGTAQIIPESWVAASTRPQLSEEVLGDRAGDINYGYVWWMLSDTGAADIGPAANDLFFTFGIGGQFIMVMPHLDLVVVSTAQNFSGYFEPMFSMLAEHILPAIQPVNGE